MEQTGLAVFSYIFGGIPSGYIIAKLSRNIDIRQHGSGNPGAANVYRTVGKLAGWGTLAADALKGYLPVKLALILFPGNNLFAIVCGSLAIIGHMWTVFLRFKGGKGVATSAGVFGAMLPWPTLLAVLAFVVGVAITKHISAGSILAAMVLPVASFTMSGYPPSFSIMVTIVSLLILYKHIPNMKRIWLKKELPIEENRPQQ